MILTKIQARALQVLRDSDEPLCARQVGCSYKTLETLAACGLIRKTDEIRIGGFLWRVCDNVFWRATN